MNKCNCPLVGFFFYSLWIIYFFCFTSLKPLRRVHNDAWIYSLQEGTCDTWFFQINPYCSRWCMIGLFQGSPSHSAMFRSLNLFSCSAKAYKIIGYKFVEKHLSYHHTLKIIGYIVYKFIHKLSSFFLHCFTQFSRKYKEGGPKVEIEARSSSSFIRQAKNLSEYQRYCIVRATDD